MPLDAYQRLVDSLSQEMARLAEQLNAILPLHCAPGCASCCQRFNVLAIEASLLSASLAGLPGETRTLIRQQADLADEEPCPLLLDGLCSVYAARPIICRTHGLPLAHINEELQAIEVSACPHNFSEDFSFVPEQLLFMDEINAALRAINQEYCLRHGLDPDQRLAILEIARQG